MPVTITTSVYATLVAVDKYVIMIVIKQQPGII